MSDPEAVRDTEDRAIFEAVSRGEISRIEAGRRLGIDLGFGGMLMALRRHRLPLPRFRSDPASAGVQLIREMASRERRAE